MLSRRGRDELTNGPARLTEALGIGPEHQRHILLEPPVWIGAGDPVADEQVVNTSRIGISKAARLGAALLRGGESRGSHAVERGSSAVPPRRLRLRRPQRRGTPPARRGGSLPPFGGRSPGPAPNARGRVRRRDLRPLERPGVGAAARGRAERRGALRVVPPGDTRYEPRAERPRSRYGRTGRRRRGRHRRGGRVRGREPRRCRSPVRRRRALPHADVDGPYLVGRRFRSRTEARRPDPGRAPDPLRASRSSG